MRITRLIAIVVMIAGVARSAEVPREPEKLAGDVIKLDHRLDFEGLAKITHPDDLRRFKASHLVAARLAEKAGMTEYFRSLTWASSSKQIEEMPAEKVYEAFWNRRLEMVQIRDPKFYASVKKKAEAVVEMEFIRRVNQGSDIMSLDYKVSWVVDGQACSDLEMVELRRHETTWLHQIPIFLFQEINEKILQLQKATRGEQGGADQPAATPESKPEGKDKPQPESKVGPR